MISSVLLVLSWIFLISGTIGLIKLKGVYNRLLSSAKIDSAAFLTLFISLIISSGFSVVSLKLFVIMIFYMFTNPVTNQVLASSAYKNGILPERQTQKGDENA